MAMEPDETSFHLNSSEPPADDMIILEIVSALSRSHERDIELRCEEENDNNRKRSLQLAIRSPNDGLIAVGKQQPIQTQKRYKWRIFPEISVQELGPPPDGGIKAWLQVLAGHLMCFVTWGLITSFGTFQSIYQEMLQATPSSVSWIGTTQIFTLLFVGTLSGRASDAGLVHEAVLAGTLLIVIGLFMTSLTSRYYQVFLSQGLCIGLGMGILYMPGLSVPSSYFKAKKSFAVAIIASGAGSGGLVYPAMVQQLLPRVGFAWTIRCIAFVTLMISALINLLLRMRVPARTSGPLVDLAAFREPSYIFFCFGFFFVYWAVYFTFYYIDSYGYTYDSFTSLESMNLLLLTNALGLPGRILPGFIASRYLGPLNTAIPTAFSVAIILYCWPAVRNTHASLYGFALAYGFWASAIQSLFAVSLAALTDDLNQLGTRMGMVFSIVAFASLTGSPIAGAVLQANGGDYLAVQMWAASTMLIGSLALAVARLYKSSGFIKTKPKYHYAWRDVNGPYDVSIEFFPYTVLKTDGDAIVRTNTSALCGSDLHRYHGFKGGDPPWALGYEAIGHISELGSGVSSLEVGLGVIIRDTRAPVISYGRGNWTFHWNLIWWR